MCGLEESGKSATVASRPYNNTPHNEEPAPLEHIRAADVEWNLLVIGRVQSLCIGVNSRHHSHVILTLVAPAV